MVYKLQLPMDTRFVCASYCTWRVHAWYHQGTCTQGHMHYGTYTYMYNHPQPCSPQVTLSPAALRYRSLYVIMHSLPYFHPHTYRFIHVCKYHLHHVLISTNALQTMSCLTLCWVLWSCPGPRCPGTSLTLTGTPPHEAKRVVMWTGWDCGLICTCTHLSLGLEKCSIPPSWRLIVLMRKESLKRWGIIMEG